jgi:predicted Zn-dependent protease
VGFVGSLAQLAALGSILEFSRDNEREADQVGLGLMLRAGYEPREAARIWEALLEERAAMKKSEPVLFFATHPPTEERVDTLRALAEERRDAARIPEVGAERYLAALAPLRTMLLRDEVRTREFARSAVVLDRLVAGGVGLAELHFFQGELYRLRGEADDVVRARDAYGRALAYPDPPAETWRALGLTQLRLGAREEARAGLRRYLQARPDAEDRAMILDHLRSLGEPQ